MESINKRKLKTEIKSSLKRNCWNKYNVYTSGFAYGIVRVFGAHIEIK